jgi:murein DD-endopeptidase MepM/ murein hydrolase activator NlpD
LKSKFLNTGVVLILLILGILGSQPAAAQQEEQIAAQYVIQPGDTLSKIATRFDVDVNQLTSANSITNPNQLFVGDVLVLPGVDWFSGTLDVVPVPVGETFRSVRRRYQLEGAIIGRAGGILNPSQLYAGYPLLIPTNIGEDMLAARAAVSSGESLLDVAARNDANPWEITGANQLNGIWTAMQGDVLLLPGTNQPGPGALPSPLSLQVTHGNFVQGRTTVLMISAGGIPLELDGEFIGHQLHFHQVAANYIALQGVHAMTEPGPYQLTLSGTTGEGDEFEFSQMVLVEDGGYGNEKFTVDLRYLDLEVNNAESAFVANLTAPVTSEKLWEGYFVKPTPFDVFFNSVFGTRRTYTGSDFTNFHGGVDFGGGEGTEVICAANGVVVFSGPLEIRGNATLIDHGWGIYTGYFHQSEIFVQEGDQVQEGQIIGRVGNTGRSTGAHLHWEVWAGGVQVEPYYDWLLTQFP